MGSKASLGQVNWWGMQGEGWGETILHGFSKNRSQGDWAVVTSKRWVAFLENRADLGMSPLRWCVGPLPAQLVKEGQRAGQRLSNGLEHFCS